MSQGTVFIPDGVDVGGKSGEPLTEGAFRSRFVELVQRAIEEESGELIRGLTEKVAELEREVSRLLERQGRLADHARRLELENRGLKREARVM